MAVREEDLALVGLLHALGIVHADQATPEHIVHQLLGHVVVVQLGHHVALRGEGLALGVGQVHVWCAVFQARTQRHEQWASRAQSSTTEQRTHPLTQQGLGTLAQLTHDLGCGPGLRHQRDCLARVDIRQVVVLFRSRLPKL